jgi:hypothetical protein
MRRPTLAARLLPRTTPLRGRRGRPQAERIRRLEARVVALEDGLEESRRLSQRLADVVDVVTEVLVPAADRDDQRMRTALANLNRTLDNAGDDGAPD